jgi:hypothetical protein
LFGDGDGTFAWAVESKIGNNAHSLVATDLNGDSYLDLVSGNLGDGGGLEGTGNGIGILFGTGGGSFEPKVEVWGPGLGEGVLAAADLDSDGKVDLIILGHRDDLVVLFNAIPQG